MGNCQFRNYAFLTVYAFFYWFLSPCVWQSKITQTFQLKRLCLAASPPRGIIHAGDGLLVGPPRSNPPKPPDWLGPVNGRGHSASADTTLPFTTSFVHESPRAVQEGERRKGVKYRLSRLGLSEGTRGIRRSEEAYSKVALSQGCAKPVQYARHPSGLRRTDVSDRDSCHPALATNKYALTRHCFASRRRASGRRGQAETSFQSAEAANQSSITTALALERTRSNDKSSSRVDILRRRVLKPKTQNIALAHNRIPPELAVSQVWVQDSPQDYLNDSSSPQKYNAKTRETVSQLWMPLMLAKGWLQARSFSIHEEVLSELELLKDDFQQVENLRQTLDSDTCVQALTRAWSAGRF